MNNEEVNRQMNAIWDEHHDPEAQRKKRLKELKEKRKQGVADDLGIDADI